MIDLQLCPLGNPANGVFEDIADNLYISVLDARDILGLDPGTLLPDSLEATVSMGTYCVSRTVLPLKEICRLIEIHKEPLDTSDPIAVTRYLKNYAHNGSALDTSKYTLEQAINESNISSSTKAQILEIIAILDKLNEVNMRHTS